MGRHQFFLADLRAEESAIVVEDNPMQTVDAVGECRPSWPLSRNELKM